jgi:hypothetical protein
MSYNAGNEPKGYNWLIQQVGHQGDDCLLWPFSRCTPGYGIFMVKRKNHLAHRYMCELANGAPPSGEHLAAHSCGNRRCVNPKHLSWKTHADNQLDRRAHGTNSQKRTKLTMLQATQIRDLKGLETTIETAARYGVTESNVRHIQDGTTWNEANRVIALDLTAEQVREIRRIGTSKTANEVSRAMGVGMSSVYRVRNRASYKTVA